MECNQPGPGFELVSPCSFPTTITITPRVNVISIHVNAGKAEYMSSSQRGDISTLNSGTLKLVDKCTNLGSGVSSTENDIDTIIWKSGMTDKIKCSFYKTSGRLDTAEWIHHMDANQRHKEKTWRQLHRNTAHHIE